MSSGRLPEMTQAQRDRLAFVELRLRFVGEIRRQDLVTRFGIQAAAATRDIAQYKELAPGNMEYDTKGKVYVRAAWFRPLFDFPAERILTWLSQGYGDGEPIRWKGVVAQEGTSLPGKMDLDLLSVLTRAIHQGAAVSSGCEVGPYARLRPGTVLGQGAKIGNFVETKKTVLGPGAKANHLTYLGDATIGAKANIGAGTITCNYDGFGKYRTVIGEGAFIGSNSALVAPLTIGDRAIVAAGSAVTQDVEADALAIVRPPQVSKTGWAKRFRALALARKGN